MKTLKLSLIALSFSLTSASSVVTQQNSYESSDTILLSCITLPWCGSELSSPVPTPKDVKTETQDAKDEKLA